MVQLVTLVRHRHRVDDLMKSASGFHVDHCERVGLRKVRAQQQSIAKFSGAASIASFGDAWKVGSGLIVI